MCAIAIVCQTLFALPQNTWLLQLILKGTHLVSKVLILECHKCDARQYASFYAGVR